MNATSLIHDHVRCGRITPEQGSWLLELRRELAWRRRPRWQRALILLVRAVFS